MKQEFELSLDVLNDVLDTQTPFAEALRKKFQTNVDIRPMRSLVAGLVGCELRHQIYFEYVTRELTGLEPAEKRLLWLALANAFFYRRFDVAETRALLVEKLGEEKCQSFAALFELSDTPENYIPGNVDRKSPLYLSLRFNVPEWTVKILAHFGGAATYQSLRKFARPSVTTLRVRTSALGLNKLLENPDFAATPVEGIVTYKGSAPLRRLNDYKKGLLFAEKLLTKAVLDAHQVAEPGEVLLYNGNADSSLERELIESYGDRIGMNLATPNVDEKVEVTKLIKEKNLHNVNFFSAPDPMMMEAAVSSMQKLVIASPSSTNFDLIPASPDYLLHFDTQKMDEIIAAERATLEGAAKYVDEGGTLLYIVYTISRKEGHQTVADFLKAHPEFSLVEEKQHFPYEDLETAAYVAELRKGEAELTIPPALADLAAVASSAATPAATATSK